MAPVMEISGADAHLIDTGGFGIEQYCGAFVLQGEDAVALIETGPSTTFEAILDGLKSLGISQRAVTHVLPTHIHLDHAGAAWKALEAFPNATAYIHEKGAAFLTDPALVDKLLGSVERAVGEERFPQYGTFEPLPADRVQEISGGEELDVGGRTLELLDAPGHAPHQYNVLDAAGDIVYVGDAAGIQTPDGPIMMTTPPPAFDLDAWQGTLDMLELLDATRLALTHFGVVDKDEHLKAFRARQDAWVDEIRELHDAGATLEATVEAMVHAHPEGQAVYDETTFFEEVRMNTTGVWLWLERQDS